MYGDLRVKEGLPESPRLVASYTGAAGSITSPRTLPSRGRSPKSLATCTKSSTRLRPSATLAHRQRQYYVGSLVDACTTSNGTDCPTLRHDMCESPHITLGALAQARPSGSEALPSVRDAGSDLAALALATSRESHHEIIFTAGLKRSRSISSPRTAQPRRPVHPA